MLLPDNNDFRNDCGTAVRSGSLLSTNSEKRGRSRRGGALIEFTLTMPLLLLVITGMVWYGLALHNDLVMTNAVNTGAQLLSISRGQTTDPCATAYSAITSAAPTLTTSQLSITYVINGTSYTSNTCTGGASNMVQGATLQISATYPYTLAVVGGAIGGSHSLATQVSEFIQ